MNGLPETMRASVLTEIGRIELEERPVPAPGPGEVLVRVASVGVCGSDVHWYREGHIGDRWVSGPIVLGHECGGTVVAVGEGADSSRVGERVAIEPQHPCRHCRQCVAGRYNLCENIEFYATPPIDGAFCQYVTIGAEFAFPVPDSLSDDAVALLEPLSVAIATLRKAQVAPGSSVLIAGAGPIGIITAQTAKAFGAARIVVSDPVEHRRELALKFGATAVLDPRTESGEELAVDAFVDASGAPPAVAAGIAAVRGGGYAILVGMGGSTMNLPVALIQNREITVTGIFRYTDTWPAAIHLAAAGLVDLDAMVTGRYDLAHVQEALDADHLPTSLKSIVEPNA